MAVTEPHLGCPTKALRTELKMWEGVWLGGELPSREVDDDLWGLPSESQADNNPSFCTSLPGWVDDQASGKKLMGKR